MALNPRMFYFPGPTVHYHINPKAQNRVATMIRNALFFSKMEIGINRIDRFTPEGTRESHPIIIIIFIYSRYDY